MAIKSLFYLSGKVAIVTGGGDDIGKGCCEMLAEAGASVVVSDVNIENAEKVAKQIKDGGGKALGIECNVLKDEDLVRLVENTVKEFGGVHILVNNAGGVQTLD